MPYYRLSVVAIFDGFRNMLFVYCQSQKLFPFLENGGNTCTWRCTYVLTQQAHDVKMRCIDVDAT